MIFLCGFVEPSKVRELVQGKGLKHVTKDIDHLEIQKYLSVRA